MERYKVSIVIPVYNVEKYLQECLDSVCNQTLRDIEIICVDDGSTDSSAQMLDERAAQDSRMKVIHKENGGYGKAMNIGMQMASGKYIGIVEPDDYIELNMMERLYNTAESNDVDFVKSDFWTFLGDDENRERKHNRLVSADVYERVLTPLEDIDVFWGFVGNWTGLYRKSFLEENGIRHNETPGASYQDQGFWFQVHVFAKSMYILSEAFYNYRQDNPNASMLSKKKVFCIADEYQYIYTILKQNTNLLPRVLPLYMRCKYGCFFFNLNRIEEASKGIFGEYLANEFRNHELQDELSLEYFSEQEKRKLKAIMATPKKCIEMMADILNELNILLQGKKIWIYGAGLVAERTWEILSNDNKKNVQYVIVTSVKENQEEFHNIPVETMDSCMDLGDETSIGIIAMSRKYVDEIIPMLEKKGIKNYIVAKDYI